MGGVVAGTVALENWDPRCLNLLCKSVNVLSPAKIDTTLYSTPPPILLDPIADGDAGATAVFVIRTIYVPPLFFPYSWQAS